MNISSLSDFTNLQQQPSVQKISPSLAGAVAAIVASDSVPAVTTDVATSSVAGQLQSSTSALQQMSNNLAQASSTAQVADSGLAQLQNIVENIATIAQQAGLPTLSSENQKNLDTQFKQWLQQIDTVVASTSFNGKQLLNGGFAGSSGGTLSNSTLSIDNFSSASLFAETNLGVNSLAAADNALTKITNTRAAVGNFIKTTNYAAASVDSAIANQYAAHSTLQESDFTNATNTSPQTALQNNVTAAISVQGNRLPPSLLWLVEKKS